MSKIPADLLYTEKHEYVRKTDDKNLVVVGITDYAQGELGDVVYVELPKAGTSFGRMVSELFAPLAGTVTEVNTALDSDPALVNREPYGDGWMIKLRIKNPADFDQLLDAEKYKQLVGE